MCVYLYIHTCVYVCVFVYRYRYRVGVDRVSQALDFSQIPPRVAVGPLDYEKNEYDYKQTFTRTASRCKRGECV